MQKKFRRLAAVMLCLTLLAVPALAAGETPEDEETEEETL